MDLSSPAENTRHMPEEAKQEWRRRHRGHFLIPAGVLIGLTDLLDPQAVRDSIPEIFAHRPKLVEPNLAAFDAGLNHVAPGTTSRV